MICEYFEKFMDFISQKIEKYSDKLKKCGCCEKKEQICEFLKKKTTVKLNFELENYLILAVCLILLFKIFASINKK